MGHTDVTEVPRIVATLRDTYKKGVTRPLEWRRRQLHSLRSLLEDNLEPILAALAEDLHKGKAEGAIAEVWDPLGQVSFMDQNLESLCGKEVLPTPIHQRPLSFEIWKEPFGVVTIIGPWNFPFSLVLNPLAGALAAGNTCVVKPSEVSVASGRLLAELIPKYFDPSVVAVVTGGVEQTTALLAEKVDNIMYTGGGVVGRIVMAAAAKNLTPVTLELGGKCPAYVDESADVQVAARRIVFGKSFNGGQACVAPDHVFVHAKVRDSFLRHLKLEHDRLFPGDEKENVDKARIVNERHFQRVSRLLNENHGGKVVLGGGAVEAERFVEFTVVLDPSPDSALMQEEIFAPILPVVTVASVDEAIAFCGGRPTPLAAYVFQRDSAVCKKWLSEVASGGACVNDCIFHIMNNEGGLAGKGESGMGTSRGRASFEAFTHRKVVGYQLATFDPLAKYPPFEGVPVALKMLVTGDFPGWVKPAFWGVVLSTTAVLALFVSKHVSLSVSVSFH